MKIGNILLIGGLAGLAYYLFKRQPRIIEVADNKPEKIEKIEAVEEAPKMVVMNERLTRSNYFESFRKGYNTSKFKTVSPPRVVIVNR